jgi:hypothetical protein
MCREPSDSAGQAGSRPLASRRPVGRTRGCGGGLIQQRGGQPALVGGPE